jgi:hypothetical protein
MVAGLVRPLDRSVSPWAANAIQLFLVLFLTREFIRVTQGSRCRSRKTPLLPTPQRIKAMTGLSLWDAQWHRRMLHRV